MPSGMRSSTHGKASTSFEARKHDIDNRPGAHGPTLSARPAASTEQNAFASVTVRPGPCRSSAPAPACLRCNTWQLAYRSQETTGEGPADRRRRIHRLGACITSSRPSGLTWSSSTAPDPRDDITDLDRVRSAVAGCSVVVHLAAKVGLGVELSDIDDYVRQNDLGTAVVLRAAAEAGVSRIVLRLVDGGLRRGRVPWPDHGPVAPPPRSPADLDGGRFEPSCPDCGSALVARAGRRGRAVGSPQRLRRDQGPRRTARPPSGRRETGGEVAALRFHNVYGPGMPPRHPVRRGGVAVPGQSGTGRAAQVFEDGRQRRNFVHVNDVAAAVAAAAIADSRPASHRSTSVSARSPRSGRWLRR